MRTRRATAAMTASPSSRASGSPTQRWMPVPNPTWPPVRRATSYEAASCQRRGSRLGQRPSRNVARAIRRAKERLHRRREADRCIERAPGQRRIGPKPLQLPGRSRRTEQRRSNRIDRCVTPGTAHDGRATFQARGTVRTASAFSSALPSALPGTAAFRIALRAYGPPTAKPPGRARRSRARLLGSERPRANGKNRVSRGFSWGD